MTKIGFIFLLIATMIISASCTKEIKVLTDPNQRTAGRFIEQSYAEHRKKLLSDIQYDLEFDVTQADSFSGVSRIQFQMSEASALTVDFSGGTVVSALVNSKPVEKIEYNNFFITFPKELFGKGSNTIEVNYKHPYSATGSGLYRFVDPEDKNVYIYTDFEPYDANQVFPSFDQPDLKATYASRVVAPKKWEIVSSVREDKKETRGDVTLWSFPRSKLFSTYIFSLHGGPYKVWTSEAKTKTQKVPLRVMARQSLAKYVDPQEWFTTTKQGFEFFEEFFGFPYPYGKYDEIIVPDFNSGAMENVAAVTFSETRYVSRGKKQRVERRTQAEVQLHELAHMWFGNLVTMKWWNDIWLNESFATYAAYRAIMANTPYKEGWTDFIVDAKSRAYREDQLVTTHPIVFTVADTDVVFANFDGITYGKGASVLKQLAFLLGEENFKTGIQSYFKKYAFGNTELKDFIGELEAASGQDLKSWQKAWLETAQVNTVKVDYNCQTGKTESFRLVQTAPKAYPTMRPHKTQVAVMTFENNKFKPEKVVDVSYSAGSTPVPELDGLDCAKVSFVYPNYNDHDYAKVELDRRSIASVFENISFLDDEVLRAGLWSSLWEMVIDQKLSATRFFDIVLAHSAQEKSLDILRMNLERLVFITQQYLPKEGDWANYSKGWTAKLSKFLLKNTQGAGNEDLQKMWFKHYVESVVLEDDLKILAGFLKKPPGWMKFSLDQDRRWDILSQLSAKAYKNYAELLQAEKIRDTSSRGEKSELAAQAAVPEMSVKKEFWQKLSNGPTKEFPLGTIRPVAKQLFPAHQEELHKQFGEDFFKKLRDLKAQPGEFLTVYTDLAPAFCATESVKRLQKFAEKNGDLPPNVIKRLKIHAQESERCIGIRQKVRQSKAI